MLLGLKKGFFNPFLSHSFICVCIDGTVEFPMDLLEKGLAAKNFGMLGLGDIVVPGKFLLAYNLP